MNEQELTTLLDRVRDGELSSSDALAVLREGPFKSSEVAFAELDHHRPLRNGLGEVVYGESKTAEQIVSIVEKLGANSRPVLVTRIDGDKNNALVAAFPTGRANKAGRTFIANAPEVKTPENGEPYVAVVAAGTSDAYAAEEACEVCVAMDTAFVAHYDVGVAGLHRLLDKRASLQNASALVVVAGMEGALPSVVGGLFGKPIFAVPTSVGYGASFGGIAPLLAMLNSCAAGVAVMNIDNGFSAGFAACQVIREIKRLTHV
ncbi:MAG: nickel pincer cofactor biosynthesis protein LarB [Acidobacteria bacterium]|nr:nickel pincer cofactor biosynthesis protein LarB [Acidobacteriota bacterium]